MARKPRILDDKRKNRASPEEMASFVDKFEELEQEVAAECSAFMLKCKKIRERQRELLDDAKSQSCAKKVVKAVAEARKLEAKAKAKLDDLEDDDREVAIDIRKALGDYADLPLGQAAVQREDGGEQDDTTAAIIGAVKGGATDAEWEAAGRAAH